MTNILFKGKLVSRAFPPLLSDSFMCGYEPFKGEDGKQISKVGFVPTDTCKV